MKANTKERMDRQASHNWIIIKNYQLTINEAPLSHSLMIVITKMIRKRLRRCKWRWMALRDQARKIGLLKNQQSKKTMTNSKAIHRPLLHVWRTLLCRQKISRRYRLLWTRSKRIWSSSTTNISWRSKRARQSSLSSSQSWPIRWISPTTCTRRVYQGSTWLSMRIKSEETLPRVAFESLKSTIVINLEVLAGCDNQKIVYHHRRQVVKTYQKTLKNLGQWCLM